MYLLHFFAFVCLFAFTLIAKSMPKHREFSFINNINWLWVTEGKSMEENCSFFYGKTIIFIEKQ